MGPAGARRSATLESPYGLRFIESNCSWAELESRRDTVGANEERRGAPRSAPHIKTLYLYKRHYIYVYTIMGRSIVAPCRFDPQFDRAVYYNGAGSNEEERYAALHPVYTRCAKKALPPSLLLSLSLSPFLISRSLPLPPSPSHSPSLIGQIENPALSCSLSCSIDIRIP
jgi:hypothetical protein